jgi:hypothetical protein
VYHVRMKTLLLAVTVLLLAACLAGCGEASSGDDYVAEPRRVPEPKTCSDYTNAHEILLDERAGKLTKADKQWLDMDGDGRYCEERGVAWKGERAQQ